MSKWTFGRLRRSLDGKRCFFTAFSAVFCMLFYAFLRPQRRGGKKALSPRPKPKIAPRDRRKHGTAAIYHGNREILTRKNHEIFTEEKEKRKGQHGRRKRKKKSAPPAWGRAPWGAQKWARSAQVGMPPSSRKPGFSRPRRRGAQFAQFLK